jgi:hypothetical protein
MNDTGFDFADFYDEVISRVGGEQSTAEDVIRVQRSLRLVLERWSQRYNTWRTQERTIACNGVTGQIDLPADVDDVIMVARIDGGSLTRVTTDRFFEMSGTNRPGVPGTWTLLRGAPNARLALYPLGTPGLQLRIWPVLRPAHYSRVDTLMDDAPGRWMEAMILSVSHDMARKRPGEGGVYNEELIARLDRERLDAEDRAHRNDRDRAPYQFRMG